MFASGLQPRSWTALVDPCGLTNSSLHRFYWGRLRLFRTFHL
jgi:hypothetical protein